MIRAYYRLAKPGIIYGNLLSTVAGFVLASRGHIQPWLFIACVAGISMVMACGCVLNNYLDRGIDEKMERTKNRASVTGEIPLGNGIIFAAILGLIGFALFYYYTNSLTTWIAFAGLVVYVVLYGYFKRRSSLGTVVGSLSGAVPPLVGYVAVTNKLDAGALIVFLILVFWQMPHFYAIAIFRKDDYAKAGIPVLPLTVGVRKTKFVMVTYIVVFTLTALALSCFRYTHITYAIVMTTVCLWWLYHAVMGLRAPDESKWARKMFRNSLVVLLVTAVAICFGALLP